MDTCRGKYAKIARYCALAGEDAGSQDVHSISLIKNATYQCQMRRDIPILTPFYVNSQQILCGLADVKSDGF